MANERRMQLTTYIVTPSDLKRARLELESISDTMQQAKLRQPGKPINLPTTSRLVENLTSDTGMSLLKAADRDRLKHYLTELERTAPVLHFSFASEPSAAFLTKLVFWLRENIHPCTLVHIGLQPSIAAGCIVRSLNKQFDFSLSHAFDEQRSKLIDTIMSDPAKPQKAVNTAEAVKS